MLYDNHASSIKFTANIPQTVHDNGKALFADAVRYFMLLSSVGENNAPKLSWQKNWFTIGSDYANMHVPPYAVGDFLRVMSKEYPASPLCEKMLARIEKLCKEDPDVAKKCMANIDPNIAGAARMAKFAKYLMKCELLHD